MRNAMILAAVAALAFTSFADAKSCKDPTTHKFVKCPAAAGAPANKPAPALHPAAATAPMAAVTAGGAPHCTKGKPCGHSCIAMNKVCHK